MRWALLKAWKRNRKRCGRVTCKQITLCNSYMQVSSVNQYLNVVVRIPVRVVYDDSVCTCKIDPQTSSSCGEQEAELLSSRCWDGNRSTEVMCVKCVCVFVCRHAGRKMCILTNLL